MLESQPRALEVGGAIYKLSVPELITEVPQLKAEPTVTDEADAASETAWSNLGASLASTAVTFKGVFTAEQRMAQKQLRIEI